MARDSKGRPIPVSTPPRKPRPVSVPLVDRIVALEARVMALEKKQPQ